MIDSVQSASSSSFEPLFLSAPPPKRGRPKGSKAAVVQEVRFLGIHHFAFIRSSFLGLDLRQAFDRYLAWGEASSDLRYIHNRKDFILKHIIEAARQLDATLPAHAKITKEIDLVRSDVAVKPVVSLPTLEDWVESQGMDPDAWSEAELIVEYKAAFGLDNQDAIEAAAGVKDLPAQQVRALNYLESDIGRSFTENGLHTRTGERAGKRTGQRRAPCQLWR